MERKEFIFQEKAANKAVEILKQKDLFCLKSPTGSGKTLITGMIIEKFLENFYEKNYTFIYIAPSTGNLDFQGYQKISNYVNRNWVNGFKTFHIGKNIKKGNNQYLQNIDYLEKNYVYFVGWSLLKKNANLTNLDSERKNFYQVISNTNHNNNQIVLIIDESHREYKKIGSNTKKEILKFLKPIKTIELSATLDNPDWNISLEEVREEAAIKKKLIINPDKKKFYKDETELDVNTEINELINSAIQIQKKVKKNYWNQNLKQIPLALVQIPNEPFKLNEEIKAETYYLKSIKKILEDKGYQEGKNYAIWLDKIKSIKNKKELIYDSKVEFLIFKQSIATGWDIPRANLLIRLRESKNPKFNIQTLGRILRNPFFKYYKNYYIDNAFVLTRDEKFYLKLIDSEYSEKETEEVTLSERSYSNNLKINKIIYKDTYPKQNLIDQIFDEIIKNDLLIKEIISQINKVQYYTTSTIKDAEIKDSVFDSKTADKLNYSPVVINDNEKNKRKIKGYQKFFSIRRETLFETFIKYKSAINVAKKILEPLYDRLSLYLINLDFDEYDSKLTIKKFYQFVIMKNNTQIYQNKSLYEWVLFYKNKILKPFIENTKTKEIFQLSDSIKYNKNYTLSKWDGVNTYDRLLNVDALDSKNEKTFYKMIETFCHGPNKNWHLYRNDAISQKYFVEYFDRYDQKRKFYPDFLLINDEKEKVLILEIKSRNDIDSDLTDSKLIAMKEYQKDLALNYQVEFFIVKNVNNSKDLEFIDLKNDTFEWKHFIQKF